MAKLPNNKLSSYRTPNARKCLKFGSISPLEKRVFRIKKLNSKRKSSPKNEIKRRAHDRYMVNEESYLLSVDTPKRDKILTSGIGSKNMSSVIGHGYFGTVFKAKYKDKTVAVKVIKKDIHSRSNSLTNELNGIILKHPNVVKTIKVVNNINTNYALIIMEFCFTTNMQHLIDYCQTNIYFKLKLVYSLGICKALQYCHKNRVIHLDVKPKNILIGRYGLYDLCKLCDFGNSLLIDENFYPNQLNTFINRQGTAIYMAPELLHNGVISEKADVFSLAITMWQLLHEEIPYSGEHLHTVVYRVVSQNYRPKLYKVNTEKEAVFADLYKMCWSEHPNKRPTLSYIIKSLEDLQKY